MVSITTPYRHLSLQEPSLESERLGLSRRVAPGPGRVQFFGLSSHHRNSRPGGVLRLVRSFSGSVAVPGLKERVQMASGSG